jgi:hypothetical protein
MRYIQIIAGSLFIAMLFFAGPKPVQMAVTSSTGGEELNVETEELSFFSSGINNPKSEGVEYEDSSPVSDNGVAPKLLTGASNQGKTCAELDDVFGEGQIWTEFKIDPPASGIHVIGSQSITISDLTSDVFDWESTIGIDAVIVKGGNEGSNIYLYQPPGDESFKDGNLGVPNASNNSISHITFCLDFELIVTKDAETEFTRTYDWDIEKTVNPSALDMFKGDSGEVEYQVEVTKDNGTDSDWAVSGKITIHNPAPTTATVTEVTDVISGDISVSVNCGVSLPYSLASGATLECDYSAGLPDGQARVNTVTVETSGAVPGASAVADVIFGEPTKNYDSINVSDTYASDLGTFTSSDSVTYSRSFSCNGDEGQHDNTATIVELEKNDSASVTVNCYELTVVKTAATSLSKTYEWDIVKNANESKLTLAPGQQQPINYSIEVSVIGDSYGDWKVSGIISIYNPAPIAAVLAGVTDIISPDIQAEVDCPSLTVPSEGYLTCTYLADLTNGDARTNTATAVLQNTPSGTTDFTGNASVSFAGATVNEIDDCITISDTNSHGPQGVQICVDDQTKTINYSVTIGPYTPEDCGVLIGIDNTASFETNDTKATGEGSWKIEVDVVCTCTLTQGYWKTHSEYGKAPYDDNWAELPNRADEPFFSSGQTWYEVFWTAPKGGNVYYQLAHQYMAAELNRLNGASVPNEVENALIGADTWFNSHGPNEKLKAKDAKDAAGWASTLGKYNEGIIGPGHCSE